MRRVAEPHTLSQHVSSSRPIPADNVTPEPGTGTTERSGRAGDLSRDDFVANADRPPLGAPSGPTSETEGDVP
jgi:hypothetical protein